MKRNRIVFAAATVLAVVSGGTAASAAGPIDGAGVIHGCYYRATATGSHQIVLQDVGRNCPTGSRAISWNQPGRPGPGGLLPGQLTFGVGVPDVLSAAQYHFAAPYAVVFDGTHLWVTNASGNSVTEVNASDGSVVQVFNGASYGFNNPQGLAFDGRHLWIANGGGASVTEINSSDGSLVRVLSGGSYDFAGPQAIAFDGKDLWVTNTVGNSVTEVNAATGSAVQVLSASNYLFAKPLDIAYDGLGHVWITNNRDDIVTEVNTSDGSLVRTVFELLGLQGAAGIVFDGQHLWIADNAGAGATELNAADGSFVRFVSTGGGPQDIAFDGVHVWVTTFQGAVTEIDAGTGSVVNTLSSAAYGFQDTTGIAFDGNHLWIADVHANTLTAVQGP